MFNLSGLPDQCATIFDNPLEYLNSVSSDDLKLIFNDDSTESREKAISFGVATLLCFIIENFTGPSISSNINENLLHSIRNTIPDNFIKPIDLNGEQISHLASLSEFIWISFNLLRKYNAPPIWISRCAIILQKCLSGPSEILQNIVFTNLQDEYGIERSLAYRLYHQYTKFLEELEKYRKEKLQFDFELTGILGKKTKFQQDSKAQLTLKVTNSAYIRENSVAANTVTDQLNEREIHLEDDSHLLERPHLEDEHEIPPLTDEELCYLLLECYAIADRAVTETKDERRIPLLETVLQCKPHYSITTCALFFKSIIEKKNMYTQQRASIQVDSIIQDYNKYDSLSSNLFKDRLSCFFLLDHPALWEIRRESGLQMLMIGAARSASKIFIEHKMWDELVMCCQVAKDPQLALDVIDKEEKTPLITTIIGELKNDKDMLIKAWEASNHKFSRAMRSLARIYLHEFKWDDAADCYRKALELNRLYPDCWFSLGCCSMNVGKYEEAVGAFQQVVSQKPDDADSFSNLAICLQQLKKFPEAHKAISQAVRFDRRRVKLWENYIIISLNSDNLNDALLGIEEAQKADNKWCNTPLLYEVLEDVISKKGDLQRLLNVLDLISQNADCGFDFWTIYADICEALNYNERALDMRNTVIKLLEKNGKVMEPEEFKRIVDAAEKLVNTTKKIMEKKRGTVQRIKVLIKKYGDDFSTTDDFTRLQSLQNVLNQ
ncbi:hypothetical protein M9Y10_012576 [Tritrichomonas musculus]|uniref:TPR Domain containing protein n=1 Tax=Tritrichomonas musculus TaxID=1915356 RepID=A0ABR2IDY3_9EUKA